MKWMLGLKNSSDDKPQEVFRLPPSSCKEFGEQKPPIDCIYSAHDCSPANKKHLKCCTCKCNLKCNVRMFIGQIKTTTDANPKITQDHWNNLIFDLHFQNIYMGDFWTAYGIMESCYNEHQKYCKHTGMIFFIGPFQSAIFFRQSCPQFYKMLQPWL